jgi:pimeloyl-ACP methyl ester carboxylesterase
LRKKEGYVELDNYRLYYQCYGAGFPILLIHGTMGSSIFMNHAATWELGDWLVELGFCVVNFDQHGFGKSTPITEFSKDYFQKNIDDAIAVLDHLKIGRVVVIGVSEGAAVALNLAIHYPERIVAVVADSAGYVITEEMLEADLDPDNAMGEAWQQLMIEVHGDKYASHLLEARKRWQDSLVKKGTDLYQDRLGEINCPTLLTACTGDIYRLNRQTKEMGVLIPGARVKIFRGGDHPVMWTLTQQFSIELSDFLIGILKSK